MHVPLPVLYLVFLMSLPHIHIPWPPMGVPTTSDLSNHYTRLPTKEAGRPLLTHCSGEEYKDTPSTIE